MKKENSADTIGLVAVIIGLAAVIIGLGIAIIEWRDTKTNERTSRNDLPEIARPNEGTAITSSEIAGTEQETAKFSVSSEVNRSGSPLKDGGVDGQGEPVTDPLKLEALAQEGNADAQFKLGEMYRLGDGVPRDDKEALKWYTLAAIQGDVDAQYNLGLMYAEGRGVEQNDKTAVKWYTGAAEQGHAGAQYNLGNMYREGRGILRDDKEAVRLYTDAAEQGHAGAQYNLGNMYREGRGILQDDKEAVRLYTDAAEQGNALAQFKLGEMYEKGRGVSQDDVYAYMWFSIAALSGHKGAFENEDIIAERMTSFQLEKAQELALECYQKEYKECLMGSH